jgi:hypothetical protein
MNLAEEYLKVHCLMICMRCSLTYWADKPLCFTCGINADEVHDLSLVQAALFALDIFDLNFFDEVRLGLIHHIK